MKKTLKYIILLSLICNFSNVFAKAFPVEETVGTCILTDKSGERNVRTTGFANITEADCKAKANPPFFTVSWTENPPPNLTDNGQPIVQPTAKDNSYYFLAPLPCDSKDGKGCINNKLQSFDPAQQNVLGIYLNLMIKIIIGLAAVLSVVMIVMGGVEYMTSELSHSKESGKEKITQAIIGLIMALGAYAILYTINPSLLKSDPNIPNINARTNAEPIGTCHYTSAAGASVENHHTTKKECDDLIVKSGGGFGGPGEGWTMNPIQPAPIN